MSAVDCAAAQMRDRRGQSPDAGFSAAIAYPPGMFNAVLFDIGDTLVHFSTWNPRQFLSRGVRPAHERLCEMGFTPPPLPKYTRALRSSFLRTFVWSRLTQREVCLADVFCRLHRAMGLPVDDGHMADMIGCCTRPLRELFTADPEAIPMLRNLHAAGLKIGVVSNTMFPAWAIDDVLEHDGLLSLLPVRIYSSDVRYMKPDARIFRIAIERMNLDPARTLMVGDRISKDVKGAARVGMRSALLCLSGKVTRRRPRPDYIINRLSELPEIVLRQPAR